MTSALLLTEDLPLRTSKLLGAFSEDKPLARRYGDLTKTRIKGVKLSSTQWFMADHAMKITAAQVNNLTTKSFEGKVLSGVLGDNYTVVNLAAPAPDGATVTASGVGLMNPITGQVIENPADIIEDFLKIANRTDPWWGQLRTDCAVNGIALAGSLTEKKSIRATIDDITDSAGAIWCYGMARLYPVLDVQGFRLPLDVNKVSDLLVTAALTDTADILRLSYAWNEAEDKPGAFMELTASPQRFGGTVFELNLKWVKDAKSAELIGRRWLARAAGERYDVAFTAEQSDQLLPGTWLSLQNHPQWPFPGADPFVMLIRVAKSPMGRFAKCSGETILSFPEITVTAHSVSVSNVRGPGISISEANGIATITIHDPNDKALVGAYVSLDHGSPKKTDAKGQVTFPVVAGTHLLQVHAQDFQDEEVQIVL